ncbi:MULTISPECIES: helix-turn-helix transcriptional regulator [Bacillaceae]|uniref:helix-turn-helix transcriptional regulator n=1 Tax=Bacillaceae TaxID=186817 RepID=UPI0005A83A91|nr:helix-turn-helix transcriptional regulator [Bacillus rubiinfantis]
MDQKKYNISRLRQYRMRKGVSQTHVAKLLGYRSPSGYANIESGKTSLTLETALKIADILNEKVEDLFFG